MRHATGLTEGSITKGLLSLALPLLLGNAFQQVYYLSDLFLVGRILGEDALAAVGAGLPAVNLMLSFLIGAAGGFSVLLANCSGASDRTEMLACVDTCAAAWLIISATTMALGGLLAGPILVVTRVPQSVMPSSKMYVWILLSGIPGNSGYNFLAALRRGQGDARSPLLFLILATQGNIILDLLFMGLFHWGVCGAALATMITQQLSCIGLYWYLQSKYTEYRLHRRKVRISTAILREGLAIGLPSSLQQIGSNLGLVSVQGLVNTFGNAVMAGYVVVSRIDSFAGLPGQSLEHAVCSFTAQNLGAGCQNRVRWGLRSALISGGFIAGLLCVIIWICGKWGLSLVLTQPESISFAWDYLRTLGFFYILQIWTFCFNGYFRGQRQTVYTMVASLGSLWLIRLPISNALSTSLGSGCLQWGLAISWIIGFIVLIPKLSYQARNEGRLHRGER